MTGLASTLSATSAASVARLRRPTRRRARARRTCPAARRRRRRSPASAARRRWSALRIEHRRLQRDEDSSFHRASSGIAIADRPLRSRARPARLKTRSKIASTLRSWSSRSNALSISAGGSTSVTSASASSSALKSRCSWNDAHRVALHPLVGLLARDAALGQLEQHACPRTPRRATGRGSRASAPG